MAVLPDLSYSAEHSDARLVDVFLPEQHVANGCGMLWIHGGGWRAGARSGWHPLCEHFSRLGYVCATADYRLAPDWTWPAQIEDVRLAMAWFRARAGEYGFSAGKVAAAGSSAGGHLVALLGTIGEEDDVGVTPELTSCGTRPNAVIPYCPVTMLADRADPGSALREARTELMGCDPDEDPERYRLASPAERVTGREPPYLFLHGTADVTVPTAHSEEMHRRLLAAGVASELVLMPGVGHGFGYNVTTEAQKEAIGRIERFLAACFAR